MKLRFMEAHRGELPVDRMARLLDVSRSTFYRYVKKVPSNRALENERLTAIITDIFRAQHGCGAEKIRAILRAQGIRCGKTRVWKLMKKAGITGKLKRVFRVRTTDSNHNLAVSPNLLNRDFAAKRPDRVWVSDITYLKTRAGWVYLCVVLDLFSRKIVGWAVDDCMPAGLVVSALEAAVATRAPQPGLIFHSDRGVQYASREFRAALKTHRMKQSMSRKANCWDNACAESFFSILKEQLGATRFSHLEEARHCLFDYIELFYNPIRVHGSIEYMSPNEYENMMVA